MSQAVLTCTAGMLTSGIGLNLLTRTCAHSPCQSFTQEPSMSVPQSFAKQPRATMAAIPVPTMKESHAARPGQFCDREDQVESGEDFLQESTAQLVSPNGKNIPTDKGVAAYHDEGKEGRKGTKQVTRCWWSDLGLRPSFFTP